jgi:glutamate synthase (NADPH/NADH) large chain
VSEVGVGTVAAGVAKAGAHVVVIAGDSGGTGAAPLSSIKRAGLPWELGLAETQQVLVQNQLRSRVKVQVDGGLRTGRDVIIAALLGAEEFGFATSALIVEGCIMLRKCHLNTCSVGIATQDPELRKRFLGKPEHVVNFFFLIAEEVRERLAELGFRKLEDAVGHVELLTTRRLSHWKAARLDLGCILARADVPADWARRFEGWVADPFLEEHIDRTVIERAKDALERGVPLQLEMPIRNTQRTAGTMLSSEIVRRHGAVGLVDDTVRIRYVGSAGQSFGAFLAKGITLELEGDANDYLGKGLSGGQLIVYPPRAARFASHENVIAGNVVLYGATGGAAYIAGQAGERFAVRNSGARAVVEGIGDHGCEYMTGGVVVVLGHTGRNFAAGMSGGMAFVFDKERRLSRCLNHELVDLEPLTGQSDIWLVQGMIEDHVRLTGSSHARRILDNWELMIPHIVKVMPTEYRRVLGARRGSSPPAARKLAVVAS